MDNLSLILFISFAAPLLLAILLCKDESKQLLIFLFIGTVVALFCGELNGILIKLFPTLSTVVYTTNVSPFVEELFKAFPVLVYAFFISPKRQTLLECAAMVGVGFALLENAFALGGNAASVSIPTAIIRGFGAGIMHATCTMSVGYALSFINIRRKVFYSGTIAILAAVSIYHAIYNMLVQSSHQLLGFILPTLTCIPMLIILANRSRKEKQ